MVQDNFSISDTILWCEIHKKTTRKTKMQTFRTHAHRVQILLYELDSWMLSDVYIDKTTMEVHMNVITTCDYSFPFWKQSTEIEEWFPKIVEQEKIPD